ncbi:MAG: thioesterase family protein [Actinomycetota bacterium]
MAHRTPLTVRFNEIDPYGHVNHSVYVTYCEVGRTDALTSCGIPLEVMAERGYQLVVTRIEVRFRRAATAGDTLVIETGLADMKRASGTWHQRILRTEDDGTETLLVTAEVTAGITDRTGRPTRPPEWLFPALEQLRPGA